MLPKLYLSNILKKTSYLDILTIQNTCQLLFQIRRRVLFSTNGYFEPFYQKSNVVLVYAYGIFIPIIFSISHSTSMYLIWWIFHTFGKIYALIQISLYVVILSFFVRHTLSRLKAY